MKQKTLEVNFKVCGKISENVPSLRTLIWPHNIGIMLNGCTHRVMILFDGAVNRHQK